MTSDAQFIMEELMKGNELYCLELKAHLLSDQSDNEVATKVLTDMKEKKFGKRFMTAIQKANGDKLSRNQLDECLLEAAHQVVAKRRGKARPLTAKSFKKIPDKPGEVSVDDVRVQLIDRINSLSLEELKELTTRLEQEQESAEVHTRRLQDLERKIRQDVETQEKAKVIQAEAVRRQRWEAEERDREERWARQEQERADKLQVWERDQQVISLKGVNLVLLVDQEVRVFHHQLRRVLQVQ